MNWEKLMSRKRLGRAENYATDASRTDFQKDYDRVCFSSAFRRLQDKTQVFPLSGNDYVRTRLTHSLECSCVGRSLGAIVGEYIVNNKYVDESVYCAQDFGAVVAAACLAHDIGNPPFGHTGEDAMRHWVAKSLAGKFLSNSLGLHAQRADFVNFEGNAQGFRLLARLQAPSNIGGMQLTCATLGTFTKYPYGSYDELTGNNSKFGFFDSDKELFKIVAEEVGLKKLADFKWSRHPLALLVEAADDICYHVVDIEDGYKLGCLSYEDTVDLLKPISCKDINNNINKKEHIEYLRATAVGSMIRDVARCFIEKHDDIMSGNIVKDIVSKTCFADDFLKLKKVAKKHVYIHKDIIEVEAAGFNVLGSLLGIFVEAVEEAFDCKKRGTPLHSWERTILKMIPDSFIGEDSIPVDDRYERTQRIFDFVSGMTDSYAVSMYKKIQGISLLA